MLYEDPLLIYADFKGRELIISALPSITFFDYKTLGNSTNIPVGGVDVLIMDAVSAYLNFT